MLKVALIGCGKIADAHASQIRRIRGCAIAGVCDREPLMAEQLGERFDVRARFDSAADLIDRVRPDVVHVTTPPDSHFALARLCLERGCHVYVEKPFTLDAREAESLVDLATRQRLKLTVGHDDQFSHVARRMRRLVQRGFLGGRPVHLESWYGYDLSDGYARALLGDRDHWVRRLPGRLLHNIISHGLARIAEFLDGDAVNVIVHGFVSPRLWAMGERGIVDELRVVIADGDRTTAYFTVSSQVRPALHQFRIYGPRNGLAIDQDQETLFTIRGARFKSYGEKFIPPVLLARECLENLATNARTFLRRDFHMKSGMKYLIEAFYGSITSDAPLPIPHREILLTARLMDAIFRELDPARRGIERGARLVSCAG